MKLIPILVIVGPTAAGKSAIADRLADLCDGVIINADARQMYQGIEILSAADDAALQKNTRLYSWKSVDEPYSFAEFVSDADREILKVFSVGKIPIVVGGTGLYIDALIDRFVPPPLVDPEIREKVQKMSHEEMLKKIAELDPAILNTIDVQNPRRVQRALEVVMQTGSSISSFGKNSDISPYFPIMIGWTPSREILHERIEVRVTRMWNGGAIEEIQKLLAEGHGLVEPGMQAIGIHEICDFLNNSASADGARERMIERTRQYARRQLTWFRRNKKIVWYNSFDVVWHSVHDFLQTNSNQF